MNSKKTTLITEGICVRNNLGQKLLKTMKRFSCLVLLIALHQQVNAQAVCHQFICPDDVTMSITSETDCDLTINLAQVAFFNDEAYGAGEDDGSCSDENSNLIATLGAIGFQPTTLINSISDFDTDLPGNSVLIIGEQEEGDMVGDIDAANLMAIQDFVTNGGTTLVFHSVDVLNGLFGFTIGSGAGANTVLDAGAAVGTCFTQPALDDKNATNLLVPTLPAGSVCYYKSAGNTSIASIPYGAGQVYFIGWDWFDGAPNCDLYDPAWNDVVECAIRTGLADDVFLEGPTFIPGGPNILDFVDEFDPANWVEEFNLALGSTTVEPTKLNVTGSNNPAFDGISTWTQVCITAPCDGRFRFDWEATMLNDVGLGPCGQFNRDEPSYVVNGVETILPAVVIGVNEDSGNNQRVCVEEGDQFCFRVNSMNRSCFTRLDISDFRFVPHKNVRGINLITPDGIVGDVYPVGEYVMQYELELPSGCTDTCEFNLTVQAFDPGGLTCQPINLSLNEIDCTAELTPAMVVTNDVTGCLDNYEVEVQTEYGDIVTEINGDLIGQDLTYKVCIPSINLCCWNTLTVEDYFPPEIMCEDVQVECNATDTAPVPEIISNDCGNTDLILLDSTAVQYDCHPTLSGLITKTWTARDKAGNEGNVCVQMIEVLRPVLAGINPPSNYIDNNALECKEFTPDENGNPTPGIDTDIPTIGMPPVPIWPITPDFLCNVSVRYVDNVLPGGGCTTTIIRNWEIREWHCEGEEFISLPQMIQIRDTEGPTFEVPADYTVNVDMDFMEVGDIACKGKIFLPGVEHAYDNCNGIDRIDISSPHDFEKGDGLTGAELLLSVGDNLIEYIAYDSCYNETIQTVTVTVVDEREPVAICDTDPVVSLNSNGEGSLYAHDVDSGSYDECGPVTLLIAKMTDECGDDALVFDHHVSFCCEEVGVVMVVLQVTDAGGNTAQCMMEVTVDNKYQPSVIVPEDVTVDCTTPYDLDNLSQFGDIQVFGSCGGSAEDNGVSEINDCGEGKIIRTFIVTNNGGGTTTYQQTIYFENPSPFDGDDPAQLMFPEDYEDENICFNGNSKTQFPPSTTGEPVIVKDVCDLVGVSYEDEVLLVDNVLTACYKIRRTWSVVDWCQQENGVYLTWEAEQYIIISNDIAPEIETNVIEEAVDDEITIKTCEPQAVVATATGTMDCDEIAYWEYELIKDGMTVETGVSELGPGLTGQVTLMVDEGLYEIIWTMRDGCSNEDISRYAFEVINKKLPTPYAKEITVALDGTGEVEIWIVDIDNGSEHSCGYDFELSFGCDDVAVKSMTFTCDELGPNEVVLCATDELGNQNYVTTTVTVTEGSGSPCVTLLQADVVGQIISVQEELMGEVEVRLLGAELAPEMTNESGEYAFTDMPLGGSYVVDPYDNSNPLLGVSTLDLVMIQRHVLGTSSLTDPYQLIAADINGSEDITAIDLVELRKLILGIYAELPTNDSWRFVDANHEFTAGIDPWAFEIPEQYEILNLQGDMNIPFIGIKTGDVNFSGVLNVQNDEASSRKDDSRILNMATQDDHLSFSFEEELDFMAFQIEMQYNGDVENIVSIGSTQPGFDVLNSYINTSENTITVSWNGDRNTSSAEAFFFTVTDSFDPGLLELRNTRISSEVYTNEETHPIELEVREGDAYAQQLTASIYPNPWQSESFIEINLHKDADVSVSILDISGKLTFADVRSLSKGTHTVEINDYNVIQPGVYYCLISDGDTSIRRKMIKLQ